MKNVCLRAIQRVAVAFLFLIQVFPADTFGQSVTGIVTDNLGNPVENALVFVANSTIQTQSASDGRFTIDTPPFSGYEIAAYTHPASIGSVRVTPETMGDLSITISPFKAKENSPSTKPRDELLEFFNSTAFSWTKNAGDVTTINPDDLVFQFDEANNVLTASSTAPFVFETTALGYRVAIYHFELGGNQIAFGWTGFALYTPLEAEKSKDQRKWDKNRQKAYEGSLRHFLKALADERLKKEEFAAYFVEGPGSQSDHSPILEADLKSVYGTPAPILFEGKLSPSKRLDYIGWLRIQYYGSGGDSRWERYIDRYWPVSDLSEVMKETMNISFIELPDYQAIFDPSGVVWPTDPPSIRKMGYWSFFRLADMLPADWMPEK